MDIKIAILFNTKWDNLGNNLNKAWLEYRWEIFTRFTYSSLMQQTDNNFDIWLICHPESKELLSSYKADKVKFIYDLKEVLPIKEKTAVLKIDSDDLFHLNTVRICRQFAEEFNSIKLLMFTNGYTYNISSLSMRKFDRFSMPTYLTIFPMDSLNEESFRKYCWCDLTKVRTRFEPILNKNRMVCLLDHKMNLHSDPRRNNIHEAEQRSGIDTELVPFKERRIILKEFGVIEK